MSSRDVAFVGCFVVLAMLVISFIEKNPVLITINIGLLLVQLIFLGFSGDD